MMMLILSNTYLAAESRIDCKGASPEGGKSDGRLS